MLFMQMYRYKAFAVQKFPVEPGPQHAAGDKPAKGKDAASAPFWSREASD